MTILPHYPLTEITHCLNLTDFRNLGETSRSHQRFFRSEAPWVDHIQRLGLQVQQPFSFPNFKAAILTEIENVKAELQTHIDLDNKHRGNDSGFPLGDIKEVTALSARAATVADLVRMKSIISAHWPAKVLEMLLATKQVNVPELEKLTADQRRMNTITKVVEYQGVPAKKI